MNTTYCADAIALFQGKIVLIERLNTPKGFAIPGGHREIINGELEDVTTCAIRELEEETGLKLIVEGILGRYDAPGRDPRSNKTTDVVYGTAQGTIKDEPNKTRVFLLELDQVDKYKDQFAFDHYKIIKDYMKEVKKE